jgi:glucosylceramidase
LQTTGFVNKDGSLVVVVMNTTDKPLSYHLCLKGKAAVTESLPHSIATLLIK